MAHGPEPEAATSGSFAPGVVLGDLVREKTTGDGSALEWSRPG